MQNKILTDKQIKILEFISHNSFLRDRFYWTGGTVLAEIYFKHRLSEDLDLFSDDLYSKDILIFEINKLKLKAAIKKIEYYEHQNRQQFELSYKDGKVIKLEFVFFPFDKVKSKKINPQYGLRVDEIKSIAENKIFALYESAESKHAYDLYWIANSNKNLNLKKLFANAQKKFGVNIDKVIFLEKALEAIDKIDKIRPLIFEEFTVSKNKLIEFFRTIK